MNTARQQKLKREASAWFTGTLLDIERCAESEIMPKLLALFRHQYMNSIHTEAFRSELCYVKLHGGRVNVTDLKIHYETFINKANNLRICDPSVSQLTFKQMFVDSLNAQILMYIGADSDECNNVDAVFQLAERAIKMIYKSSQTVERQVLSLNSLSESEEWMPDEEYIDNRNVNNHNNSKTSNNNSDDEWMPDDDYNNNDKINNNNTNNNNNDTNKLNNNNTIENNNNNMRSNNRPTSTINPRHICRYYNTARGCYKGDECTYKHIDKCQKYMRGECPYGDRCILMHIDDAEKDTGGELVNEEEEKVALTLVHNDERNSNNDSNNNEKHDKYVRTNSWVNKNKPTKGCKTINARYNNISEWVLDSAATSHYTCDKDLLYNVRVLSNYKSISTISGSIIL
jgi:hypothetical protein